MLDKIEYAGNKLPDPIVLFVILSAIIILASYVLSLLNISAVNPATNEKVVVHNLLSKDGLIEILTGMVKNFSEFPPLGAVLVVMIGVGLADESGFFSVLMKRAVVATPKKIIIPSIIFIAIVGNVAADATQVVLPPIAAAVLMAFGYHPLVGLVVAYASTVGAFSANIMIGMTDTLAAGFTEIGAKAVNPDYVANPAMNYYFIAVSAFFLLIVATWVTYKFTIPRFGTYTGMAVEMEKITELEKRGLRWSGIVFLVFIIITLILVLPQNGILRNPETGSLIQDSPFMAAIVPLITIFFLIPGLFYGLGSKTIRSSKDFADMLGKAMSTMGPYIVLVFVTAQMLAYFSSSNLGPIIAIKGAEFLESVGFTGIPLFIFFIIFVGFVNILIGSASAKWAILAPIFVPMFMILGYDPAFTQAMYRIGDSITNPITPMLPYLVLLLSFAKQYDKKTGLGTLISALFPYTIFFGIFWILLLIVWYLLGIPVGPQGPIYLPS
ncbi:AbgT family transporter [Bacillus aquiflavi]|uniref:AbgT family transporter n=1 Tax=Bacillus aquiflavi TaxID=2672567 RepID=UPI001CA81D0D|nr:AbgT family transporter [Bacillus aquiflavi]UAC49945.1 AbgT family transporter [Bacillus aquiflavi]